MYLYVRDTEWNDDLNTYIVKKNKASQYENATYWDFVNKIAALEDLIDHYQKQKLEETGIEPWN